MGNNIGGWKEVVRPVGNISGCYGMPQFEKPPVLAAFFDPQQGPHSGIMIVTEKRIENFSAKYAFLAYSFKTKKNVRILCADFQPNSAFGSCIIVASTDYQIHLHEAKKLHLITHFAYNIHVPECSINASKHIAYISTVETKVAPLFSSDSPTVTCMLCPLNNALICGFCDGTLASYFLETRKRAAVYIPPEDVWGTVESKILSTPVTSISFCKQKNFVIAGYKMNKFSLEVRYKLPNISFQYAPILAYSLESGKCVERFIGCRSTILATHYTEDDKYLLACSIQNVCIWDACQGQQPLQSIDFCNVISVLDAHNCALAAAIDPTNGAIFVTFDGSFFVIMRINLPNSSWGIDKKIFPNFSIGTSNVISSNSNIKNNQEKNNLYYVEACGNKDKDENTNQNTHHKNDTTNIGNETNVFLPEKKRISCIPIKLFYALDNEADSSLSSYYSAFRFIWYESRTETVVLGDRMANVKIATDVFGKKLKTTLGGSLSAGSKFRSNEVRLKNYSIRNIRNLKNSCSSLNRTLCNLPIFSLDPLHDIRVSLERRSIK